MFTAKSDNAESTYVVNKREDVQQSLCILGVDHNENKQCGTSTDKGSHHTITDGISDNRMLTCEGELTSSLEASSQVCCPLNDMSDVIPDATIQLNETVSIDSSCNVQCNSFTFGNSYYSTDSDVVSQSQGLQLTITQKMKTFAMELDMMKAPISARSLQDSLPDSLTDMSATVM